MKYAFNKNAAWNMRWSKKSVLPDLWKIMRFSYTDNSNAHSLEISQKMIQVIIN